MRLQLAVPNNKLVIGPDTFNAPVHDARARR